MMQLFWLWKPNLHNLINNMSSTHNIIGLCDTSEAGFDHPNFEEEFLLLHTKLKNKNKKVILFLHPWWKIYDSFFRQISVDVCYVDNWLNTTYKKLIIDKECPIRQEWSYNKDHSFLFLMGKVYKKNRLLLFYKLVKAGLVDRKKTFYTLRAKTHDNDWVQSCFNVLKDELQDRSKIIEFLEHYNKEIDLIATKNHVPNQFHYTGIPYNVKIYKNTNFQIIAESSLENNNPFITEKTWIAMANKMPFIIIGNVKSCEYLERLGFKTYRNYMPHPEYDNEIFDNKINDIVSNIKNFNKYLCNHKKRVKVDTEHNFKMLKKLYYKGQNELMQKCKDYNIDYSSFQQNNHIYKPDNWQEHVGII